MLICKTNLHKKMNLDLNQRLRKSGFPLNLTDGKTDRRTDISNYRVALLLKRCRIFDFANGRPTLLGILEAVILVLYLHNWIKQSLTNWVLRYLRGIYKRKILNGLTPARIKAKQFFCIKLRKRSLKDNPKHLQISILVKIKLPL